MNPDRAILYLCLAAIPLVLLCEPARAFDPGWKRVRAALPVPAQVIEVADAKAVCAPDSRGAVYGCYDGLSGTIFLQAGMAASDRECALRHETAHADGWTHGPDSTLTARLSCGPT